MVDSFCRRHKSLYFKIDPDIKLFDIDADGNPVPGGEDNTDLVTDLVKMGYTHRPLNYLFEGQQPRFTFRIPTDSDIDTVKGRYEKIVKRRLKQAAADGVKIVEGTRRPWTCAVTTL
jgi:lipid II:glycine glycyltransferase (peptidoglycan interpeptide bridge formation enzyme)